MLNCMKTDCKNHSPSVCGDCETHSNYCAPLTGLGSNSEILTAIREYHSAVVACDSCAKMLLSDSCDPEPARLMKTMLAARTKMFSLAGVNEGASDPRYLAIEAVQTMADIQKSA